jgi:hypothetical protein
MRFAPPECDIALENAALASVAPAARPLVQPQRRGRGLALRGLVAEASAVALVRPFGAIIP